MSSGRDAARKHAEGRWLLRTVRDYEGAVARFTEAIAINPYLARAYRDRGEAYRHLGMEKQAKADLERLESILESRGTPRKFLIDFAATAIPTVALGAISVAGARAQDTGGRDDQALFFPLVWSCRLVAGNAPSCLHPWHRIGTKVIAGHRGRDLGGGPRSCYNLRCQPRHDRRHDSRRLNVTASTTMARANRGDGLPGLHPRHSGTFLAGLAGCWC